MIEKQKCVTHLENETSPLLYVTDIDSYNGLSERIKGFQRIRGAIAGIPGVASIYPYIFQRGLYEEYKTSGLPHDFTASVWHSLKGDEHPLIVRRLFPDRNGEAQPGPRSGNITSEHEFHDEITKFYEYFDRHYSKEDVSPEIMVHPVIDVTNPPKLEDPFLPRSGGDVIPLGDGRFQVRATFGADESVQGFPSDVWEVEFEQDGSASVHQTLRGQKTESHIPKQGEYETIVIPYEFQEAPALNVIQVLTLAEVCRRMMEAHGPNRLEFDGTKIGEEETLVIIESAPFSLQENFNGTVADFKIAKSQPVMVFRQEQDFSNIPQNELVFAHVPSQFFQGNEKREALTRLSTTASERNARLVVFASGNIATQHAVRVLQDSGHAVIFIEDEQLEDDELIRVYAEKNRLLWERENPIVLQDRMEGRGIKRVGGKALGLRKLDKHGFKIPPYFVIETSLFRRIIEELGLREMLENLDTTPLEDIKSISEAIASSIRGYQGKLPPSMESALAAIGEERFSVRSSATCEDDENSYAGIFDTFLDIAPDGINKAVLDVLASCVSEQAVRVQRTLGVKPSETQMAVTIHRFFDAEKAGTIFTKDHISQNLSQLRIEAVKGLGEEIAEGTATTHQSLVIDKKKGTIIQGGGQNVLMADEIQRLSDIGLEVEDAFKEGPQDIEWLIDSVGNIILLQARRLT